MADNELNLNEILPDSLSSWQIAGPDSIYTPTNLFKYINGGAELYFSYGFNQLVNRTYKSQDQSEIILDIFDMGSSYNAFGLFSHARETMDAAYGQGSQYTGGLLLFWKDRYYISILAHPETAETKEAVLEMAGILDRALTQVGPLPDIINLLPEQDLIEPSIRYFHHHIWLNSNYFIAHENILHINEDTEAVLAKYTEPDNSYFVLIIQYRNSKAGLKAYSNFQDKYLQQSPDGQVFRIEDGTWIASDLINKTFVGLFNAKSKDSIQNKLENIRQRIDPDKKGKK